jgi:hypothetical protein
MLQETLSVASNTAIITLANTHCKLWILLFVLETVPQEDTSKKFKLGP